MVGVSKVYISKQCAFFPVLLLVSILTINKGLIFMDILILHFAVFIMGVIFSCLIFMACFMPVVRYINKIENTLIYKEKK